MFQRVPLDILGCTLYRILRGQPLLSLNAALSGIIVAVVGVISQPVGLVRLHVLFGELNTVHSMGMNFQIPVWNTLHPLVGSGGYWCLDDHASQVRNVQDVGSECRSGGLISYLLTTGSVWQP